MEQEAIDGVNEFLRLRAKEDGFAHRILPPYPVTKADLQPRVDVDEPHVPAGSSSLQRVLKLLQTSLGPGQKRYRMRKALRPAVLKTALRHLKLQGSHYARNLRRADPSFWSSVTVLLQQQDLIRRRMRIPDEWKQELWNTYKSQVPDLPWFRLWTRDYMIRSL